MADKIMFNGVDYSEDYGYQLQQVTLTPAERKVSIVDLPGCDGVYSQGDVFKESTMKVQLAFTGDIPEEVYTHIGRFLAVLSEQGKMEIVYDRQFNYFRKASYLSCDEYVVIKGVDICYADVNLYFHMDTPFAYKKGASTHIAGPATSMSIQPNNPGRRCPFTIKIESSGTITAVDDGTENIEVKLNGKKVFTIRGTIKANDYILIDTDEYTVVNSEGQNRISQWDGEMPQLPSGSSTFIVSSKQGQVKVQLVYYEIIF